MRFKGLLLATIALIIGQISLAQGTRDLSFNTVGSGPNGVVYAIAIQDDGKIIIGGDFTSYNGTTASKIARLNTDGTLDNTFVTGSGVNPSGVVYDIKIQDDGKILVAGYITNYNGTIRNMMFRTETNGALDNTFTCGATNIIYSFDIQNDGKIVIGGVFTSYFGSTGINRIARINSDGSLDNTFSTGSGFGGTVKAVCIQKSDGKIVVGGGFTSFNGNSVSGTARLNTNGSFGGSLQFFNGYVQDIETQGEGVFEKLIIAGEFSTVGGLNTGRIVRLNLDGTVESTFYSNLGTGYNSNIQAVAIDTTNDMIAVGGSFMSFNGSNIGFGISRLDGNGALDATFNAGNSGADGGVTALAVQPDGKIIMGGMFEAYNGDSSAVRLIRLSNECLVNIPDANFKAYLVGNTSINTNGDSEIQCSEATNFSGFINCGNSNISDLTGVEAFINIKGLSCNDNNLTTLNLESNLDLEQVISRNNQLTSLTLGNNTTIINLYTENNQLTSIDVSACSALATFTCNSNQITSLDVSNNMNLAYLRCEYNQLTSLNLGNNTNLSTLILDQNPITNINIANNTGLRSLWFSNTGISSLDVSPLSNLEVLSCWGSPMTELDLSANQQLTDVYCFDTPIQSLNLANGNNDSLVFVWIHENPALECVQVDDEDYSNTNWISGTQVNEDPFIYDSTVVFSEDCSTLGLSEITESYLSVYPNPAHDLVNITSDKNLSVNIYNMLGEQIATQNLSIGNNEIDLSELEAGVYFIQAPNSKAIKMIKH